MYVLNVVKNYNIIGQFEFNYVSKNFKLKRILSKSSYFILN